MIKFKQLYFLDPSIRGFMIMAESKIKSGSESDVTSPREQGLDFDEETLKGKNSYNCWYNGLLPTDQGKKEKYLTKKKVNKIRQQNEKDSFHFLVNAATTERTEIDSRRKMWTNKVRWLMNNRKLK